ncbi:MAG: adenylyltransferase/cytidyltransferase family protein [Actinomycetota bacterium]
MIIGFEQLAAYRGQVAMVDGCFDPLHRGHLTYFAAARALGVPVLCNIAPDAYVAGKHPPFLPEEHRATLIDALRDIDLTHLNRDRTTADVLRELRPRFYVKGSDWRGKLPEQETALCRELGIEVAYVEVTPDASRNILGDFARRRSSALETQAAEFEEALQRPAVPPGRQTEASNVSPSDLLTALNTQLQPDSIYWLAPSALTTGLPASLAITVGNMESEGSESAPLTAADSNTGFDLVVGFWGDQPLPLSGLTHVVRRVTSLASRHVCISASFPAGAEHLLSLGGVERPEELGAPQPSRELVRVLFALEGFRSRRDLEAELASPAEPRVLVMERSS